MDILRNNDESMQLRMKVVKQIEQAFAAIPYPGDDNLVDRIHYGGNCDECNELAAAFEGKHWTQLTDVEFLRFYETGLTLFQPASFRFYLPAYMRGALIDPRSADTILNGIVFNLTPPEIMTAVYYSPERVERARRNFETRVSGFTPEQASAIKAYFELSAFLFPDDAEFDNLDEVIPFWGKYPEGLES